MNVIRQTDNLLILEQKPNQFTTLVLGITGGLVPLFFAWHFIYVFSHSAANGLHV
jgi:hypothetical protein